MNGTMVWASRDSSRPKFIKVWAQEPEYVQPNGVFVGKDYLGISCIEKWPGSTINPGSKKKIIMMIADVNE